MYNYLLVLCRSPDVCICCCWQPKDENGGVQEEGRGQVSSHLEPGVYIVRIHSVGVCICVCACVCMSYSTIYGVGIRVCVRVHAYIKERPDSSL